MKTFKDTITTLGLALTIAGQARASAPPPSLSEILHRIDPDAHIIVPNTCDETAQAVQDSGGVILSDGTLLILAHSELLQFDGATYRYYRNGRAIDLTFDGENVLAHLDEPEIVGVKCADGTRFGYPEDNGNSKL